MGGRYVGVVWNMLGLRSVLIQEYARSRRGCSLENMRGLGCTFIQEYVIGRILLKICEVYSPPHIPPAQQ